MLLKNKTWYKSFDETLEKGEVGEKAFIKEFYKLDNCDWIVDLRNLERMRKEDTDFLVFLNDYKDSFSAEVKTEYSYGKYSKDKQRFFIEDISSQKQNSDGWFRYCKAEFIANYDAINKILYMFKFEHLKEYINLFYEKDIKRVDYIKLQYGATGYVVNIMLFQEWCNENDRYFIVVN